MPTARRRAPKKKRDLDIWKTIQAFIATASRRFIIASGDIVFDIDGKSSHIGNVVIAHAEPVEVWGLEPCGSLVLPTQSRRLAGTVAARRTRRAPGAAYSRSNVAEQYLCFYGRPALRPAGAEEYIDEQPKSSPAAASPV